MDLTPDYLSSDVCVKRIVEPCGEDCNIITPLRHPVDRAFSQYNFYRRHDIEEALTVDQPI